MARLKFRTHTGFGRWRTWVQSAFLLVWVYPLGLLPASVSLSFCSPVFHCYACPAAFGACPIGVLANFSALHIVPFMALGMLLLVGGLVGGFVCGWVCPFGFLQDLAAKVPTRKVTLPAWTSYGRYVTLLGLVLAAPYFLGESSALFFCRLCPAGALEGAVPNVITTGLAGAAVWPSVTKIVILGLFLVSIFFIWRPWCTMLCPLGGLFGLFNRVSAIFLKVDKTNCDACGACRTQCDYGLLPKEQLDGTRCIRCLQCTRCHSIHVQHAGGNEQS